MGITLPAIAVSLALAAPAELAFTSEGGIFSLKADGSGRAPLVPAPKGEVVSGAAWSPDGTRLVYDQGDEDTSRLMLKDAAGTRELTSRRAGVSDASPVWSPDGSTLLFTRFTLTETAITTQIVTRDVATGAERVLVTQDAGNRLASVVAPTYSPDGATIAFTYGRYDRNVDFLPEIRTMPAAGGPARTLIRRAQGPSYSPDGTRLAYGSIADHNGNSCGSDQCSWAAELYVANADGTQPRRLTKDEGGLGVPRWSADGSRILFDSDRNLPDANSTELYSIAPDGSCLTWLTERRTASGDPSWRPGSGDSFTPTATQGRPASYTPPKRVVPRNLWLGPSAGAAHPRLARHCVRTASASAAARRRHPHGRPRATRLPRSTRAASGGVLVAELGGDNAAHLRRPDGDASPRPVRRRPQGAPARAATDPARVPRRAHRHAAGAAQALPCLLNADQRLGQRGGAHAARWSRGCCSCTSCATRCG